MTTEIKNGIVLMPDGSLDNCSVCIENDKIKGFDIPGDRVINANGNYILPGIVDIHGDGFERVIMPRYNSMMPYDIALNEADHQIIANGITTAYYGITITWEKFKPLRNDREARNFLDFFTEHKTKLKSRSMVHLRYEIYHTIALNWIKESLEKGKIDFISFNDHLDYIESELNNQSKFLQYSESLGLSPQDTKIFLKTLHEKKQEALEVVVEIANFSNNINIPTASHDEETESTRLWYHKQQCHISEFPCNMETAIKAEALGDWVVLGAPNALKGTSLYNRISARQAIQEGVCHILASDYYYPSLLQIAFKLEQWGIMDLPKAWNLISANPAQACGLEDRGCLSEGMSADIIIVESNNKTVQCALTLVQGDIVYNNTQIIASQTPSMLEKNYA
ncbi:MAG: alpha-D-ribose 1-methylphosphonate 5-triphosphate diphosphatase [Spirochaetales bacterium]|nr:alpha-D-ribose 1-methylphosphonate 5-triphosphate diphosphatase [Spirochaetales bacterium]